MLLYIAEGNFLLFCDLMDGERKGLCGIKLRTAIDVILGDARYHGANAPSN